MTLAASAARLAEGASGFEAMRSAEAGTAAPHDSATMRKGTSRPDRRVFIARPPAVYLME